MRSKKFEKMAVIDVETTSIYRNSAALLQIAGVICDKEGKIIDTFNERIKTSHRIDPEASKVHGIYKEDVANCRTERAVLMSFCEWMAIHSVDFVLTYTGFDRRTLDDRCKIMKIPFNFFDKEEFPGVDGYYDCVIYAKRANLFGLKDALGRKWKLSLVAEALGIDSEGAHDALVDVYMLKDIFFKVDPLVNPDRWEENSETTSLF